MERSKERVFTKVENGIATIEFGHQEDNQLDTILLKRLEKSCIEFEGNTNVSVIILSSQSNEFFCSGLLPELLTHTTVTQTEESLLALSSLLVTFQKCSKPIVARVDGKVINAGLGLIACCDYVFATEAAAIQMNQLKQGFPPLITQLSLTDRIGTSGFDSLMWSPNTWQNAYWAREKGLYHRVFEKVLELDRTLDLFVHELSQFSVEAVKAVKSSKHRKSNDWSDQLADRALAAATSFYEDKRQ